MRRTCSRVAGLSALLCGLTVLIATLPAGSQEASQPAGKVQRVLEIAMTYLGTPYRMGTQSHASIDTSGLVWAVFREAGVWASDTPRTTVKDQWKIGTFVPKRALTLEQIKPGDRLYFDYARLGYGVFDHTGIYLGDGKFIHATPPKVKISRLEGSFWEHLAGVAYGGSE